MRKSFRLATVIGGAAAVLLGVVPAHAANSTVVVSPANQQGWQVQDTTCGATDTGSQTFVNGPATPPAGTGSRQFQIGSDGDTYQNYRNPAYSGTLLSSLTDLHYSTYAQSGGSGGQDIFVILGVDYTNDGVADDQLFFEPVYQDATYFPSNPQPSVATGTWQTWDALHGGWWSNTNTAGAGPGTDVKSLNDIIAAEPTATIVNTATGQGGFRIGGGCGAPDWNNFIGYADKVQIGVNGNTTTYDFELQSPPPTTKAECMNNGWKTQTDSSGRPFKNQGDCVSFVATGGKNTAKG